MTDVELDARVTDLEENSGLPLTLKMVKINAFENRKNLHIVVGATMEKHNSYTLPH